MSKAFISRSCKFDFTELFGGLNLTQKKVCTNLDRIIGLFMVFPFMVFPWFPMFSLFSDFSQVTTDICCRWLFVWAAELGAEPCKKSEPCFLNQGPVPKFFS
jgi:competence transcription factor ComK